MSPAPVTQSPEWNSSASSTLSSFYNPHYPKHSPVNNINVEVESPSTAKLEKPGRADKLEVCEAGPRLGTNIANASNSTLTLEPSSGKKSLGRALSFQKHNVSLTKPVTKKKKYNQLTPYYCFHHCLPFLIFNLVQNKTTISLSSSLLQL